MVERSIAWLVAGGNRRVRYRTVVRNQHWLSLRVPAINLRRLVILGLRGNHTGWALASPGDSGPRVSSEDVSSGYRHPAWPACTSNTGASDRTSPGPALLHLAITQTGVPHQSP
jgi:hypothetical protein